MKEHFELIIDITGVLDELDKSRINAETAVNLIRAIINEDVEIKFSDTQGEVIKHANFKVIPGGKEDY